MKMKGGSDNAKGERSDEIEIKIYAWEKRESEQSAHSLPQPNAEGWDFTSTR